MEVKVLFFAQLEELFGVSTMMIKDVKDISDVIQQLSKMQPSLIDYTYSVAVNEQLNTPNIVLKDTDVIALLPPFAGG